MIMREMIRLLCVAAVLVTVRAGFQLESQSCKDENHYGYTYEVNEDYYDGHFLQTSSMVFTFGLQCIGTGNYNGDAALLYEITDIVETKVEGTAIDQLLEDGFDVNATIDDLIVSLQGAFTFVQITEGTYAGIIPVTFYDTTEEDVIVNIKKSLASAFQANLDLATTSEVVVELDPTTLHHSNYTLEKSAVDILNETRTVTNSDVIGFASDVPNEEVGFNQKDTLIIKGNLVTENTGTMNIDILPPENAPSRNETTTVLEGSMRAKIHKRDTTAYEEEENYNPVKTDYYTAKSTHILKQIGVTRVERNERSTRDLDLPKMVESTLQVSLNRTRRAMTAMNSLREKLGDISDALVRLNRDPKDTDIASKIESLVKMEAKYGPAPGFTPAVDDVIDYLEMLIGSKTIQDVNTRLLLYYILSPEGSLPAQTAIVNGLENAVDNEEKQKVLYQLAFVENPQPEMVETLEGLLSANPSPNDPVLLAYSSIVSKASPELQKQMVSFLLGQLPDVDFDERALNHHILALGNTESPIVIEYLQEYLNHPYQSTQLTAIYSLRSFLHNTSVQNLLEKVLNDPETTEAHVAMIAQTLLHGLQEAVQKKAPKPYPANLVHTLVIKTATIGDEELYSTVFSYLEEMNTQETHDLLRFLNIVKSPDPNSLRTKRGANWVDEDPAYNIIEPLDERKKDIKTYSYYYSYLWGVIVGVEDLNLNLGVGAFVGVADEGGYKVFGRAVAQGKAFDKKAYFLEFTALRKKSHESTETILYGKVAGKVLVDIHDIHESHVCYTYTKPIYEGPMYTVFDFTYPIYVKVATVDVKLKVTTQFEVGLEVAFCDRMWNWTAGIQLTPIVTMNIHAEGDFTIIKVAKVGIETNGVLTYRVLPKASCLVCFTQSQLRRKNCIGLYHQRNKGGITQYAWYAWRGWCGWKLCSGDQTYQNKKKFDKLSFEWILSETAVEPLLEKCDADFICNT